MKMFTKFVLSGLLACGFALSVASSASASDVLFLEPGSNDLSQWRHVDGESTAQITTQPALNQLALSLGNEVIKAKLAKPLDNGCSLSFEASLSDPARLAMVALLDKDGRKGYVVWYDSAGASDANPTANSIVGFSKFQLDHELHWGDAHTIVSIEQKEVPLTLNKTHQFVLSYDTDRSEWSLTLDGQAFFTASADGGAGISQIYLLGNTGSFFRNISVSNTASVQK